MTVSVEREVESLAVAVSRSNACAYCAAHHGAALRQLGIESSLPQEVFDWAVRLARIEATCRPNLGVSD
jgi:AhpD family alkylhydroperoxidase